MVCQDWHLRFWDVRHVVRRHDVDYAIHLQSFRCIQVAHNGMRHRAGEKLDKQHPFGTEILRVFRFTRDLGADVGRREVFSNMFIGHVSSPVLRA